MTRGDELAYRLGFGPRRRAELAEQCRRRNAAYCYPVPRPARRRRGYRPRVYLRGGIGCVGCSVPLMVVLAVVAALVAAWVG